MLYSLFLCRRVLEYRKVVHPGGSVGSNLAFYGGSELYSISGRKVFFVAYKSAWNE